LQAKADMFYKHSKHSLYLANITSAIQSKYQTYNTLTGISAEYLFSEHILQMNVDQHFTMMNIETLI